MNPREKLPTRRHGITRHIQFVGLSYEVTVSFYPDGRPGEVFLTMDKMGTPLENFGRDAAIAVSLALQYGCPADVLSKAFLRDPDGKPETVLALVMDILAEEN